jgi:chorismate lyase
LKLNWQNTDFAKLNISDERTPSVLFHEGSLTYFIQQHCDGLFNIELISEEWISPMQDEMELLSLKNDEATFIRKSRLKCDEQTLVYARTVIPKKTLVEENKILTQLGEEPLGNILFNNATTYRSDMRYAKIPVECDLHREATEELNITSELWGRQSQFFIRDQPLLITEIFLPSILECSKI